MLFQLLLVWVQNSKGPRSGLIREVLLTLLALKPGVDAFRVANGEEQPAYALFYPAMELGEALEEGGGCRGGGGANTPTPPLQPSRSVPR